MVVVSKDTHDRHPQPKREDTRGGTTNSTISGQNTDKQLRSPDEYPFTNPAELPAPILGPLKLPQILYPNKINVNPSILSFYTRSIVPRITQQATLALATAKRASGILGDEEYEDDGNYGSAATLDLEVLQAISKRVHYGTPPPLTALVVRLLNMPYHRQIRL